MEEMGQNGCIRQKKRTAGGGKGRESASTLHEVPSNFLAMFSHMVASLCVAYDAAHYHRCFLSVCLSVCVGHTGSHCNWSAATVISQS